jgi:hypothetical protein
MAQASVPPKFEYVDVPSITETYADTVQGLIFDGQSVRLELCVTRMDEPKKGNGAQLTGKRQTACRVVLPLSAALDLSTKLGRMMATLAKRGAEQKAKQAQAAKKPAGETKPN